MSAISIESTLTPTAQLGQLFSAMGTLLRSLAESTDSAFRRTTISKLDANGIVRTYDVTDPSTGQTTRSKQLFYIEDLKTGELYKDEQWLESANKCFLIALGNPLLSAAKILWKALKSPFEITAVACDRLSRVRDLWSDGHVGRGLISLFYATYKIGGTLCSCLFDIVKIPLFSLGIELGALYGIVKPYHGRKIVAMVEHAMQKGIPYKGDCIRGKDAKLNPDLYEIYDFHFHSERPLYLAYCFQVRGNIKDPRVILVERNKI